jgi:hypothetical protein
MIRKDSYFKTPESGMTYYKGKMVDRATINRSAQMPEKWVRLGIVCKQ